MCKHDTTCRLIDAVTHLCDEVTRLHQAVVRLEEHAAGKSTRVKDIVLAVAGTLLSISVSMWLLRTLVIS
jgi:hypothetical protein